MINDEQLLQQYAQERSESAFGELVTRHLDYVYSDTLRVVNGDASLAQDITQTVFIDLARQAGKLPRDAALAGWLHRHTCYTAAKAVRDERRRQTREHTAMELKALDDNTRPEWELVAPYLNESLNKLDPKDRDALVLRYLRKQDLRAVGAALSISEDAARKRVDRALERLHVLLKQRGATLSVAALGTALATQAVTAAPAGFAGSVAATALASAAAGGGITATLVKLMPTTKLKTGLISAFIAVSVVAPLVVQHQAQARLHAQDEALLRRADQLAKLQRENSGLSKLLTRTESSQTVRNEQFNEVLRLRSQVGRLQASVQEPRGRKTNEPLSREEALASMRQMYSDRVNRLKQLFAANPADAVPELQYLTDRDWLGVVEYDHHRLDPDNSRAMSLARNKAQIHFAKSMLSSALHQYGKNNNGQFPTALNQLASYFNPPVDDSVLQGWTILPTTSLPGELRGDEDQVITQKAPINAELDQRIVVGLTTWHMGAGGTNDWGPVR